MKAWFRRIGWAFSGATLISVLLNANVTYPIIFAIVSTILFMLGEYLY